mmetsp:Transcript_11051/g.30531  ORF Transcript_11051/g.30531 Transcript_11051/m.30531 type:complete len:206 (+) Transcript_11051:577-1194(+)
MRTTKTMEASTELVWYVTASEAGLARCLERLRFLGLSSPSGISLTMVSLLSDPRFCMPFFLTRLYRISWFRRDLAIDSSLAGLMTYCPLRCLPYLLSFFLPLPLGCTCSLPVASSWAAFLRRSSSRSWRRFSTDSGTSGRSLCSFAIIDIFYYYILYNTTAVFNTLLYWTTLECWNGSMGRCLPGFGVVGVIVIVVVNEDRRQSV